MRRPHVTNLKPQPHRLAQTHSQRGRGQFRRLPGPDHRAQPGERGTGEIALRRRPGSRLSAGWPAKRSRERAHTLPRHAEGLGDLREGQSGIVEQVTAQAQAELGGRKVYAGLRERDGLRVRRGLERNDGEGEIWGGRLGCGRSRHCLILSQLPRLVKHQKAPSQAAGGFLRSSWHQASSFG